MEGLIHLIFWLLQNRVVRSGSVTRSVRCENCTLPYEYELRRTVSLRGESSRETLAQEAERRLRRQLAEETDLVPCPSCGWYQRDMVEQARRRAIRHVPAWVVVLLLASALLILVAIPEAIRPQRFGPVLGRGAVAVGATGVLIFVLFVVYRVYRRVAYNPNARRWKNEGPHG